MKNVGQAENFRWTMTFMAFCDHSPLPIFYEAALSLTGKLLDLCLSKSSALNSLLAHIAKRVNRHFCNFIKMQ